MKTKLTWWQKRRWTKLLTFLRQLPRKKFDFDKWVAEKENECGTVCCAAGWLPVIDPKNWKWRVAYQCEGGIGNCELKPILRKYSSDVLFADLAWVSSAEIHNDLSEYFGVDDISYLFVPEGGVYIIGTGYMYNTLSPKATPKQVAKHMETYLRKYTNYGD